MGRHDGGGGGDRGGEVEERRERGVRWKREGVEVEGRGRQGEVVGGKVGKEGEK